APLFADELSKVKAEVLVYSFYYAPVVNGDELGVVNFYVDDRLVESVPLVAKKQIKADICDEKSTVGKLFEKLKNLVVRQ
ncbi:MAG: hypothetical protein IJX42_01825, partial [Oscillospiraceae bacterium]|nr:hypothetical protein [Oscillospiraceae bacterium]